MNKQTSQEAAETIRSRQASLAADVVSRQYAAHPELEQRYGAVGRSKCLQDANYHLAYLADAIRASDPELFANYIAWAKVMLGKRGIPAGDLATHLEYLRASAEDVLEGEARRQAVGFIEIGLKQLPALPADVPTFLADDEPNVDLARKYMAALLRGDRHVASLMVLDAVSSGVPVKDIYIHVFQRTQYEIGRLWQTNQISVAQEHYCTAATQLIMSQLYPHIFSGDKTGGTFVAACVAGDLHEIGVRMIADFLEMAGWNTFYLGASTPTESIVRTVVERRADILGISATITYHIRAVEEIIDAVRASPECRDVKIIVGGYPFNFAPDLWRKVRADGSAPDAQSVVALAARLTERSTS